MTHFKSWEKYPSYISVFPVHYKIIIKNILMDAHTKTSVRIYWSISQVAELTEPPIRCTNKCTFNVEDVTFLPNSISCDTRRFLAAFDDGATGDVLGRAPGLTGGVRSGCKGKGPGLTGRASRTCAGLVARGPGLAGGVPRYLPGLLGRCPGPGPGDRAGLRRGSCGRLLINGRRNTARPVAILLPQILQENNK